VWAAVRAHLDAVTEHAAAPVIAKVQASASTAAPAARSIPDRNAGAYPAERAPPARAGVAPAAEAARRNSSLAARMSLEPGSGGHVTTGPQ
jgi:hypothetical protein